jgi:hypothetical protein
LLTGVVDYVVRVHGPSIFVADVVQVLHSSRIVSTRLAHAQQTNKQASKRKCANASALPQAVLQRAARGG